MVICFLITGILYETSYARCNRNSQFKELVYKKKLVEQIEGFSYAYYDKHSADQLTNVKKDDILGLAKDINEKFFGAYLGK